MKLCYFAGGVPLLPGQRYIAPARHAGRVAGAEAARPARVLRGAQHLVAQQRPRLHGVCLRAGAPTSFQHPCWSLSAPSLAGLLQALERPPFSCTCGCAARDLQTACVAYPSGFHSRVRCPRTTNTLSPMQVSMQTSCNVALQMSKQLLTAKYTGGPWASFFSRESEKSPSGV